MKKVFAGFLSVCLLAGVLAGCGGTQAPSEAAEAASSSASEAALEPAPEAVSAAPEAAAGDTVFVKDMTGREVDVPQPVEKAVVLTAGDCEIVYALGAGDRLVARGSYCDWPQEAAEVPEVGSGEETNVEEILAMEPDVVFMNTMTQSVDVVDQLSEAGVPVLVSVEAGIEGVYENISMIGGALGLESEADALVAELVAGFGDLANKAEVADEKRSVYFEVSPLEYGLWTTGKGTFLDEIATMLNMENAFGDVEGWAEVSQEQVIERNPDLIVSLPMSFDDGAPGTEAEITARSGWQDIAAVAEGRVYVGDTNQLTRPGPRLLDGATALFDYVYG